VLKLYFATIPVFQSAQHFYKKREGSGSVLVRIRMQIREVQIHMDPTDLDPDSEHCCLARLSPAAARGGKGMWL
jgi:hypothetical protein